MGIFFFLPGSLIADSWPFPPTTISTPLVDASSPWVVCDVSGRAIAAWIENGIVVSSEQPLAGNWTFPPVAISGSGASAPRLVVSSSGTVTAMWIASGALQVSQQPLNGSWSAPVTLSVSTASNAQIAGDPAGNGVVIWQEGAAIYSATQLSGGGWPVTPDVLASANGANPSVAIGSQGTVVAAWEVSNVINAATKTISGVWGTAQAISSVNALSSHPQVTVDNQGNITAAWFSFKLSGGVYSGVHPQAVSFPSGGAWGTPSDIGPLTGVMNPDRLQIDVDSYSPNGVSLVWTNSSDGSLFNLEQSIYRDGVWEGPFNPIGGNATLYALSQSVNALDNSQITFMNTDLATSEVIVEGILYPLTSAQRLSSRMWNLSPEGTNGYPCVSTNGTSLAPYGAAVWENYDGTSISIQALTYALPVLTPPPLFSAVQQAQNYGIFVQYNNLVTWSPSPTRSVNGYVLMRNGKWLASFIRDFIAYQYLDINQVQGEQVTYSIYAVDPAGNISATVTTTVN